MVENKIIDQPPYKNNQTAKCVKQLNHHFFFNLILSKKRSLLYYKVAERIVNK